MSVDAVWRIPPAVCRITNFLGEQAAEAMLKRAVAVAGSSLSPSTIRDGEVNTSIRKSRSDEMFTAPELLEGIHEVLEIMEHTLGVCCRDTEPSYGLNVHNDGDFYTAHQDIGPKGIASKRLLTFVYYLHGTPRPFQGGNLRVYDVALPLHTESKPVAWEAHTWRDWEPEHDSIVFFLPTAWHEVRKVTCPSGDLADSRFAVNGWLCSATAEQQ
ncbi:2OG-Fe(II) oxygenase [Streptomyces jumonjinensis]|uniref:2OG-Fe(II) oxygenase n=1 Tax=Streptomyces jumonjinensis TaxID=1945 RepID=UPI00379DF867